MCERPGRAGLLLAVQHSLAPRHVCWAQTPGSYPALNPGSAPRRMLLAMCRGKSRTWKIILMGQVPSGAGLAPGRARPQIFPSQSGWDRLQDQDFCHVDSEVSFLVVAVVEAVTCAGCCGSWGFSRCPGHRTFQGPSCRCRGPGAAAPAGALVVAGQTRARPLCLSFPLAFPWQVQPISA